LGATIEVPSFTGSVMLKVSIAITIHNNTPRYSFKKKNTHLDTLSNSLTLLLAKTHVDPTNLSGSHFQYSETFSKWWDAYEF
jgi:hypothetical protein